MRQDFAEYFPAVSSCGCATPSIRAARRATNAFYERMIPVADALYGGHLATALRNELSTRLDATYPLPPALK